jgi:hypothetical protein
MHSKTSYATWPPRAGAVQSFLPGSAFERLLRKLYVMHTPNVNLCVKRPSFHIAHDVAIVAMKEIV